MPEYSTDTLTLDALPFWQWDTLGHPVAEAPGASVGIPLDSLLQHREAPDTMMRKSMFSHHMLPPSHTEVQPRASHAVPMWVFVVLLVLTALHCLFFRLRQMKLVALLKSTISIRAMDRLVRDCNFNRGGAMVPMGMLVVAALCLPVHDMALRDTGLVGYLLLSVAVALLYLLRNGVVSFLGNVFEQRQETSLYITSNYIYNQVEAIVATVLMFLYFYLPGGSRAVLIALGVLVGVAFVMRIGRGMKIILTYPKSSYFYLFYYLCIVELVPVIIALKLIIDL